MNKECAEWWIIITSEYCFLLLCKICLHNYYWLAERWREHGKECRCGDNKLYLLHPFSFSWFGDLLHLIFLIQCMIPMSVFGPWLSFWDMNYSMTASYQYIFIGDFFAKSFRVIVGILVNSCIIFSNLFQFTCSEFLFFLVLQSSSLIVMLFICLDQDVVWSCFPRKLFWQAKYQNLTCLSFSFFSGCIGSQIMSWPSCWLNLGQVDRLMDSKD